MKKIINFPQVLFIILIAIQVFPSKLQSSGRLYLLTLVVLIQIFYISYCFIQKDAQKKQTKGDIIGIVYLIIASWQVLTEKGNLLSQTLFPDPGLVIQLFIGDLSELLKGLVSSLILLLSGYFLAIVTAIPLGLFIGWRKRLFRAVDPITKVLGPIPPIVYVPYAIALLPTFKLSSIFVIFIGVFWPVFMNTINGVFNVDKKIIDSAKTLNVSERTMIFEIILPASMASILNGANLGLLMSFILLTAAEMIGANSGLGWYVKNLVKLN